MKNDLNEHHMKEDQSILTSKNCKKKWHLSAKFFSKNSLLRTFSALIFRVITNKSPN